jgi:hypothetical protein
LYSKRKRCCESISGPASIIITRRLSCASLVPPASRKMRAGHRPPHQGGLPRVPVEVEGSEIWDGTFMRRLHDAPLHRATPATRVLHLVGAEMTPSRPPPSRYSKVVGHPAVPHVVLDHTAPISLHGRTFMPKPSPVAAARSPRASAARAHSEAETAPSAAPEWRPAPLSPALSPRHVGVALAEAGPVAAAPLPAPHPPSEPSPGERAGGRMVVRRRNTAGDEAEFTACIRVLQQEVKSRPSSSHRRLPSASHPPSQPLSTPPLSSSSCIAMS